jgi:hypothetical protein
MISGSTAAGEPLLPHFQFQTSAQTAEAEAIRIETIRYMLNVRGTFGHESKQSFPILLGLNHKGGIDDQEFFEYLKKPIMELFPDAAPVRGWWAVIKCDSGPGRLNPDLLASFLRYHGFILYPGVPNTTAVTQATDQSYGPFQLAVRTNLQLIIDKKDVQFVAWMEIKRRRNAPPAFDKWTHDDKEQLKEAQSDVVEIIGMVNNSNANPVASIKHIKHE